uniref:Uncharacterized protein n=1 Tax=Rhizophora mucronata TaxID=61149 RepID=A0A2P2NVN5_RHIMU
MFYITHLRTSLFYMFSLYWHFHYQINGNQPSHR